jgi:asparagine synthase (glutamine-hydrolysing)
MSAQFGRWNFNGVPPARDYIEKVSSVIAPYGPDRAGSYSREGVNILYRAFHTTKESRSEKQPFVSKSGAVITWDGRLDNRTEIVARFPDDLTASSPDVSLVGTIYERLELDCFAEFIGDWAISIWNPKDHTLVLAKDPIGARHLYYGFDKDQVTWCTVLDPLVLFAEKQFQLDEEYIAGWLSLLPAPSLTPYVGIHSVPPSSLVLLKASGHTVIKYWDFNPGKLIRYRSDTEYEEHFRAVFRESVRRRLRSDTPVLAELSGGMDSTSIVCMADRIMVEGHADTPRIDTLSCYSDSEPNWNERPFFTRVEDLRGHIGYHIDVGSHETLTFEFDADRFAATPGSRGQPNKASRQVAACMESQGNRVVLSGIGGDEVTGGVPTPMPELEDLLARACFGTLAHQLKVWAVEKKRPWFHLLFGSARRFIPPFLAGTPKHKRPAPWLNPGFVKRHRAALTGYETRLALVGPLPSFQENLYTLEVLRRQLACSHLQSEPPREKRYPYLDRDLLEFLFALPPDQLVRPGQRRSLMRRALVGLVPDEILNRKRKAYVARGPRLAISAEMTKPIELNQHMVASSLHIADSRAFAEALENARAGYPVSVISLMRTIRLETWLRNLVHWRLISGREGETQSPRTPDAVGMFPLVSK